MRIIGGFLGGRRIHPPQKMPHTRPTTDIAKEGLFNTLQHIIDFEGVHTLDIFGGTGAISYELASRGAAQLTIVEKDPKMANYIRSTAAELGLDNIRLIQSNVFTFLNQTTDKYHFIFAGPPYALTQIDTIPMIINEKNLLLPDGIFVLEHTPRNNYEAYPLFLKKKNYGTTVFSIFQKNN